MALNKPPLVFVDLRWGVSRFLATAFLTCLSFSPAMAIERGWVPFVYPPRNIIGIRASR